MAPPSPETTLVLLAGPLYILQHLTIKQGFYFGFLVLSLTFMVLRGYGRLYKQKSSLLLSDYLLFAGWILEATVASLVVVAYTLGQVTRADLEQYPITEKDLKVDLGISTIYDLAMFFPKASILIFYYRMVPATNIKTCIALHAVAAYTAAAFIITFGLDIFWCVPVKSNWSLEPYACHAFLSTTVFDITWSLNLTTDIAIFMIPIPISWKLRVPVKQKARVIAIFALGIITMSVSIARFVTINIVLSVTSIYIFSAAEINIALIVVALPTLNLFFKKKENSETQMQLDPERKGSDRTDFSEVSKSSRGTFRTVSPQPSTASNNQGSHSALKTN